MHDESGKQYDRVQASAAPEIILIHGMFMTPKCWDGWVRRFRAAGYRVSAPAWPLHESVEALRQPSGFDELAKLELPTVVDRFRQLIKSRKSRAPGRPVVVIGHSMGGLVAQILLGEGTADAAVVVDSAPPHGVFRLSWSALRSNWGIISPFASSSKPVEKDEDGFAYAFANAEKPEEQERAYREYYVPESRRVGKAPLNDAGNVNITAARGPLLLIGGDDDHIIPAHLSYDNFEFYKDTPGYSEYVLFPGRDHWTIGAPGWEAVADQAMQWIGRRFPKP